MLQTTGVIADLVDVNLSLFNLPTSLLHHYLQLSLTAAPSRASNRLCQIINPAEAGKTPLGYPWTMAADTRSEPATVRRQSWIFLFSSPLIRPQHIGHVSLPSLSTWLNIVTALMNYVSPSESHSLVLVSFTPSASQMCVFQLQGHLKASGFNKTVIKGNVLFSLSLCLLWFEAVDLPYCWITQTCTEAQIILKALF